MVICAETASGRSARLAPLDKLLIEHATEYHYLFKVLYTFKSDGTILGCYHVPNIARKVLETFLDFHVPSSKSLYMKRTHPAWPALLGPERALLRTLLRAHSGAVDAADYGDGRPRAPAAVD